MGNSISQQTQNNPTVQEKPSPVQEEPTTFCSLPEDVVSDILSRLPLETLKQFRQVCKPWCRTITSPLFASQHAARHRHRTTSLLVRDLKSPHCLSLLRCDDDNRNSIGSTDLTITRLPQLNQLKGKDYKFVGSCDGFVCLRVFRRRYTNHVEDQLYVCNPVLGEYMTLPRANENPERRSGYGFFGVVNSSSAATKEYKVIRLAYRWIDSKHVRNPSFQLVGEIFTIGGGGGSWRSIGNVPYPLRFSTETFGVFVNGALHWMSDCDVSAVSPGLIFSFDVATEEFSIVPHPSGYSPGESRWHELSLIELGGQLCLLHHKYKGDAEFIVIWVMKEYGVKDSWVIQYVVDKPEFEFRPGQYFALELTTLTLTNNQEILFSGEDKRLFRYDPVKCDLHNLWTSGLPEVFSAIACVGSLVSLRSAAGRTGESEATQAMEDDGSTPSLMPSTRPSNTAN